MHSHCSPPPSVGPVPPPVAPAQELQLAALSRELLQLSPAELGLAPRADICSGSAGGGEGPGGAAAAAAPRPRVLSAELQLLETALGEPVDTHGAVTVLLKLVQRRLDAAEEAAAAQQRSAERRAEAELCRMSAAMHESVRVIREQVQLEHAATESALQERELQILKLNLQEGVTTLES